MTAPDQLLDYIKGLHRYNPHRWVGSSPQCAECGRPHPCETFRAACGDPEWPRPAVDVLTGLDGAG